MMAEDEELELKGCEQKVSRAIRESKTRMGFSKVHVLWRVEFEATQRDGHIIDVLLQFGVSGRTVTLKVDNEPVVRFKGSSKFTYGWARNGHAYLLKERLKATSDEFDVFQLQIDDKTYKNANLASSMSESKHEAATDSDDSDHGRRAGTKPDGAAARHFTFNAASPKQVPEKTLDAPATPLASAPPKKDPRPSRDPDAKPVRHFTFNSSSPKATAGREPASDASAPAPAPPKSPKTPQRLWRMNRPGEAKAISNRIEARTATSPSKATDDDDAYETRLCELIGAPDDDDDSVNFEADVDAFTRCVSTPSRRSGGGFYSLLSEVRATEMV